MIDNTKIEKLINVPLTDDEINRMLHEKTNIILYRDIHKYNCIDDMLDPYNCCVILLEREPNYGHWVAVTKHNNDIEFFNSYGSSMAPYPDDSLLLIDDEFRKKSFQDYPYLSELLYNSQYELFYNEFQFQKKEDGIKTCGRHCVIRCILKDLNIYEYKKFLDYLCEKLEINYDYDFLVTFLTNDII